MLAGAALDLLLLGEETLELGVDLGDDRRSLAALVLGHRRRGHRRLRTGLAGLALLRPAPAAAGRDDAARPSLARRLAYGHGGLARDLVLGGGAIREDVALVDPDLHADAAKGRLRLTEAVVDVGAQRVEWHPAFAVPLGARHLRPAEPPRALDPNPLGAGLLRRLHGAFHGPPEAHPAHELVGHALGDEGGIELGLLDLLDVELHLRVAGDLGQPVAQPVSLRSPPADHDAGTRGVHIDAYAV